MGVEQQPHAGRRIELDHELVGLRVVRRLEEPEARGAPEHEPQLGLGDRQPLPGADVERHAVPAPVVDLERQGGVGLRRGVGRDALDVEVAVVLPAHVARGIGGRHRPEDRGHRVLQRPRVAARRRLHRGRADDLHQVVDDDVAQRADRVVEVTAILDAEVLGHRDPDRLDVVPVPERLEHRVGEPQVEDLAEPHLPQEVVDPEQLRLVEIGVHLRRELARRLEVVAERLLDHDAGVLQQPGFGEPLDHGPEQERRDLEVEHRAALARERRGQALEGGGVAEVAGQVGEARGEAVEDVCLQRLAAVDDRLPRALAQVVVAPVLNGDADDRAVEQPSPLEPVERTQRHLLREVARDAERDEHVGRGAGGDRRGRGRAAAVWGDGAHGPMVRRWAVAVIV